MDSIPDRIDSEAPELFADPKKQEQTEGSCPDKALSEDEVLAWAHSVLNQQNNNQAGDDTPAPGN